MKIRLFVLVAVATVWGIAVVLLSDCSSQRQARVTPTPTRTPKPTFTPTSTPTITWTPSPTPTPTYTPTTTPTPTNTPPPTATDTPTLTPTPSPIPTETTVPTSAPTATQQPTRRPPPPTATPPPPPTNTPAPPFTGRIIGGYTNCGGYAGVTGLVKHANGDPYGGVAVGVWADAWAGLVSTSEANGKFELTLSHLPPGTFRVAVVKLDTCAQQDGRPTADNCQFLSPFVENVITTAHCEGDGANQVTEVEFTGP